MPTIHESVESARGCGYRKSGGKYLVSDGVWASCGMFPIPLTVCPCCNQGIKFSRGFSWIGKELISGTKCKKPSCAGSCYPFNDESIKRVGLMFVGEKFYPTPADFTKESNMSGISKRISALPKDMVIGETWIMLAHTKAITHLYDEGGNLLKEPRFEKGIFAAFIPTRIEYIVSGEESDEELERLEKQGFKLIKVIKDVDSQLPIDKQLDNYIVNYYEDGEQEEEIVQAQSEKSARQKFKQMMLGRKTRVISVEKE